MLLNYLHHVFANITTLLKEAVDIDKGSLVEENTQNNLL